MRSLLRNPWVVVAGVVAAAVAFYLFRPDTLFVDDAVDESLADAFAVESEAPADEPAEPTRPVEAPPTSLAVESAAPSTTTVPEPEAPAEPVALLAGGFYGIDHRASGTATVYEQDGARVLRLEDDTDIQNGPDLFVWLVPTADYEGGTPETFIDLGKLKGNQGGQNYALGADFEPGEWTVLIWCKRFATPFAAAPLA